MKKKVGINIDKDLHIKVKQLATAKEISVSELYENMLKEYFLKNEKSKYNENIC